MRPDNVSGPRCCHSPNKLRGGPLNDSDLDGCVM